MAFIKNIEHEEIVRIADEISANTGQVVSKTLAQNSCVSICLLYTSKLEGNEAGRAVNYWWGMASGMIDVLQSRSLPRGTKRLAAILHKGLCSGTIVPFEGELYAQGGVMIQACLLYTSRCVIRDSRVAIAGVLAMEPRLLVLDEPAAGLDPEGRDMILSLIHI